MEIIEGNSHYESYVEAEMIINNFTFAELCYNLMKDKTPEPERYTKKYMAHIASVSPEWIVEAMKFRHSWKNRKVSVPDCVGYIMAKKLGIKFLTGDKEFESMENVEFVK